MANITMGDDEWVGLGPSAGRIEFDDQTTDEVNFRDCNVGVGVTSPESVLDIRGPASTGPILTLSTPEQAIENGTVLGQIKWSVDDDSAGRNRETGAYVRYVSSGHWNGSVAPCRVGIGIRSTAGIFLDDQLVLTHGGSVGVGVTSPGEKLEVNGNIKGSALISPIVKPASDSATALQLQTSDGTSVLNVDTQNSRIGVGTTSPGAALEISGDVIVGDGGTNKSVIVVKPPTGNEITDRRNIQNAIDSAATGGGGTVVLQKGQYKIKGVTGTRTLAGSSTTTLVDTNASFVSSGVQVGDTIINLTRHCAGKITDVTATTITVGRNNAFQNKGLLHLANAGQPVITGDGDCAFDINYVANETIRILGVDHTISSVDSASQITLTANLGSTIPEGTAHYAYYGLIGNTTKSENKFSVNDKYCIAGITMRNSVSLFGQGWGTEVVGSSAKAFNIITADPSCALPKFRISSLLVAREGAWDMTDQNDIAIDVNNYNLTGTYVGFPCAWCLVDNVLLFANVASPLFTTGIRVAGWGGFLRDVQVNSCTTGFLLDFPDDQTNNTSLYDCRPYDCGVGVKIRGGNNRIVSGYFNTGARNSATCIDIDKASGVVGIDAYANCIIGPFIEGSGAGATGINLGNNSHATLITGCLLDLNGAGSTSVAYNSSDDNTVLGNYSVQLGILNRIQGSVGIGTTSSPSQKLEVNGSAILSGGSEYRKLEIKNAANNDAEVFLSETGASTKSWVLSHKKSGVANHFRLIYTPDQSTWNTFLD